MPETSQLTHTEGACLYVCTYTPDLDFMFINSTINRIKVNLVNLSTAIRCNVCNRKRYGIV